MRTTTRVILFLAVLSIPLPATAGAYLGFGGGPRSGPLFEGETCPGGTLCVGYVPRSDANLALGIGIAYNWANLDSGGNVSGLNNSTGYSLDWATISETVIRPEVLFHPVNESKEGHFFLAVGPSMAKRTISLEMWGYGGNGGNFTFVGNDPWTQLINGIGSSTPLTEDMTYEQKVSVMGWHARVGFRIFHSPATLELLHEQAFDSDEDLGGTSIVLGAAW